MNNIILRQTAGTETVSISVIEALYNIAINNNIDSTFEGNLFVSKGYQEQIDYLNANTGLSISCNTWYIRIEDPEVKRLLLANISGSDGVGITTTQAANATFADLFKNNTTIQTFDNFDKFTTQNSTATYDFYGCSNLRSINLSNVSAMKTDAFKNCTSLTSISSLGPISSLPNECFAGCTSLQSFVFPSTLKQVGLACFGYCTNLSIDVADLTHIQKFGGAAWSRQWNCWTKSHDNGNIGASVTGNNFYSTECTEIGPFGFNKDNFKTINLPNLSVLGISAFANNPSLEEVISLGNITTIGNPQGYYSWHWGIFGNCPNLKKVKLPETLTEMENEFFMGDRSLQEFNIPAACTSIGTNAFTGHDGYPALSSLHTVVCRPTTPPTLNSTFPNNANLKIYVPDASLSAYQSASGWSNYSSKIVALSTYTGDL